MSSNGTAATLPAPHHYTIQDFGLWADRRQQLFLLCIILPCVAVPVVGLRLFTSLHVLKRWHVDDTLITIATFFSIAQSVVSVFQSIYGAGEHILNVLPSDIMTFLKLTKYGGVVTYNFATVFIKVSVIFFYLRFAVAPVFRRVAYGVIFVTTGYSIAAGLSFLYGCDIPGSEACQATAKVFIAAAVLNVVTDLAIIILPIWLIWPMRLPVQYKVAVALIMMGGGFVVAVSIIRLEATLNLGSPTDPTYEYGTSIMWSVVETWVGLICACLPCLKAFVSRYISCGLMQRFLGPNNFRLPSIGLVGVDSSHSHTNRPRSGNTDSRKQVTGHTTGSSLPSAPTVSRSRGEDAP